MLITQTVGTCLRYRVTGLAAEAAFFAILSLPPLIFGLAGSIGFIANRFDLETIEDIKNQIIALAERALTAKSVQEVIVPTLDDVLEGGGRFDIISIGFVLALWSGSRALNVFVDTITIMYGMGGRRGIVKTRALSFTLYCVALVIGVIVLPLVLAGPDAVDALLPRRVDFLNQLYWPVVTILSAGFLNTLYHLSVPVRTPWVSDLPGSFLALSLWILGSFLLRWTLQSTVGGTSIYGPLAAPIAVLLWLYLTSIAVLIGAALNAVVDRNWPHKRVNGEEESAEDEPESVPTARDEEIEPVMKAEADPHHHEAEGRTLTPVEQPPPIVAAGGREDRVVSSAAADGSAPTAGRPRRPLTGRKPAEDGRPEPVEPSEPAGKRAAAGTGAAAKAAAMGKSGRGGKPGAPGESDDLR